MERSFIHTNYICWREVFGVFEGSDSDKTVDKLVLKTKYKNWGKW